MVLPRVILELWDGLACEGGRRKARINEWESGSYSDPIDPAAATFSLAVPLNAHWLRDAELALGDVVRITDHLGRVTEWLVSAILDGDGLGDGLLHIEGQHPIMRLARCGPIRSVSEAGQIWENLGIDNGVPRHYWDTYIEPSLLLEGIDWVQAGTWDWTDRYSIAWQSWKPLQLLVELRTRAKRAEIDFRRVGDTHYEVDFLRRRGAGAKLITLHPQRNLRTIRRELRLDRITTVIQPQGITASGAVEPAGIQYAAYEVTAIAEDTPQQGRHTLTIDYPGNGTTKPILWDDQYGGAGDPQLPNRYVLLPDASLVEIVDTIAATQQLVVEGDVSSLQVGDHIELRANEHGQHLLEIANPAAVKRWGRIHRTLQVSEARGERNLCWNPFAASETPIAVYGARINGALGTTDTIALKELPPGLVIEEDWVLALYPTSSTGSSAVLIASGGTVNGAGEVTLTLANTIQATNNLRVYIHAYGDRFPERWSPRPVLLAAPVVAQRDTSEPSGTLEVEADGAQDLTLDATSVTSLALKGFTAGDVVQWGDYVLRSGGSRCMVVGRHEADGDGKLVATVIGNFPGTPLSDEEPLTVVRPELLADGGMSLLGMMYQDEAPSIETPPITIRHDDTLPVLRVIVAIEYLNWTGSTITLDAAGESRQDRGARVQIVDTSGPTVLATIEDKSPRTIASDATQPVLLQALAQLTETSEITVRITPPRRLGGTSLSAPRLAMFVRWVMLALSADPEVPPIDGSHANTLVREGLSALEEESTEELVAGYEVEFRDLSASGDYVVADEAIVPGGDARLYSRELGIDTVVRIVERIYDLRDPENGRIVLATDPRLLSRTLSRQRGPGAARVVVQVDVGTAGTDAGLAGGGTGGVVSEAPDLRYVDVPLSAPGQLPVRQTGSLRVVIPPGDRSTAGAHAPKPIERDSSGERVHPKDPV